MSMFGNSISTIKPRIPGAAFVNHLHNCDINLVFITSFEMKLVDFILEGFKGLISKDDVVERKEVLEKGEKAVGDKGILLSKDLVISEDEDFLRSILAPNSVLVGKRSRKENEENQVEQFNMKEAPILSEINLENFGIHNAIWKEEKTVVDFECTLECFEFGYWHNVKKLVSVIKLEGLVEKGFGRGSKLLGVPTANLSMSQKNIEQSQGLVPGVYCGFAKISRCPDTVYKAAISIGWNPSFNNTKKTIEAYLLSSFEEDFYGDEMELSLLYYIRAEADFKSLGHLVQAIHCDIQLTQELLKGKEGSYKSK